MRLTYTESERAFRAEAADWLQSALSGEFSDLRGLTNRVSAPKRRLEWEQHLGQARWSVVGWPAKFGGRDATLSERLIFAEEYAAAGGPPRLNHLGVELLGPTILTYGTDAQKSVFLPAISAGEAIWCQGYSEPSGPASWPGRHQRALAVTGSPSCWSRWINRVSRSVRFGRLPVMPSLTNCSSMTPAPQRTMCLARSAAAGRSQCHCWESNAVSPPLASK